MVLQSYVPLEQQKLENAFLIHPSIPPSLPPSGLFMGAILVVLSTFLGPKIKRRWRARQTGAAGYVSGEEGGMEGEGEIEAQGRRRGGNDEEGTAI